MNYIYLCVNYDSSGTLEKTIPVWKKFCNEIDIYVVDNFKNDEECNSVVEICKKYNANIIFNENTGYGDALNKGINSILSNGKYSNDSILFFGNVDIVPKKTILPMSHNGVPVLNIYQDAKSLNPFLTKIESNFVWVLCLSAKFRSKIPLYIWYMFRKLIKPFRGQSVAAVHGSLFCLSLADIKILHPIFDPSVFLYCEELFFMKKIKEKKLHFIESSYAFDHIGSVSTGRTIKKNNKEFFSNWCKSMRSYCND